MDWDQTRLNSVLDEVMAERKRQYDLYGSNPFNKRVDNMLLVLSEEVGEVNAAMIEYTRAEIRMDMAGDDFSNHEKVCIAKMAHVREELIQVAAVAAATVELIDFWANTL